MSLPLPSRPLLLPAAERLRIFQIQSPVTVVRIPRPMHGLNINSPPGRTSGRPEGSMLP